MFPEPKISWKVVLKKPAKIPKLKMFQERNDAWNVVLKSSTNRQPKNVPRTKCFMVRAIKKITTNP